MFFPILPHQLYLGQFVVSQLMFRLLHHHVMMGMHAAGILKLSTAN